MTDQASPGLPQLLSLLITTSAVHLCLSLPICSQPERRGVDALWVCEVMMSSEASCYKKVSERIIQPSTSEWLKHFPHDTSMNWRKWTHHFKGENNMHEVIGDDEYSQIHATQSSMMRLQLKGLCDQKCWSQLYEQRMTFWWLRTPVMLFIFSVLLIDTTETHHDSRRITVEKNAVQGIIVSNIDIRHNLFCLSKV